MRETRSLRVRLALGVGLISLALFAVVGYAVIRIVDRTLHDNARAEVIRALQAKVGFKAGSTSPASSPTRVEVGQGPKGAIFIDPVLSGVEVSTQPGETTVARETLDGKLYYVALFRSADDSFTVGAAAPLAGVEDTIAALRRGVVITAFAVSLLLTAVAAIVTGRALRPVAAMRAEADVITHGTLGRRLAPNAGARELSELAKTLNSMLDRLETSARAQRQFSSDASHELRSPLATIRAQLELALAAPESLRRRGDVMLTEIDRIDTIVADLLALSRADEGTMTLKPIDLDELVRDYVVNRSPGPVAVDLGAVEHVQIIGDERLLAGLVRNLIDNALGHARTNVVVSLSASDQMTTRLIVDDDGPGIPADQREKVFERFVRLDDGRSRDSGGAGLGLAVALAAARAHAGSIEIASAPLGGARLTVTLATGHA